MKFDQTKVPNTLHALTKLNHEIKIKNMVIVESYSQFLKKDDRLLGALRIFSYNHD